MIGHTMSDNICITIPVGFALYDIIHNNVDIDICYLIDDEVNSQIFNNILDIIDQGIEVEFN